MIEYTNGTYLQGHSSIEDADTLFKDIVTFKWAVKVVIEGIYDPRICTSLPKLMEHLISITNATGERAEKDEDRETKVLCIRVIVLYTFSML